MNVDILAFAAHPDDIEISAGGTLLRYASEGKKMAIVDFTQGEMGTRGNGALRMEESQTAASKLKLLERINLGFSDCYFEETEENLQQIIQEIRYFKPKIVLANSILDRHPDHARAAKMVERACFLAGLPKIESERNGVQQTAYRPKIVLHYIQDYYIKPDFVVDITPFMEDKIDLIQSFSSQFFDPHSMEPETPISSEHFFKFVRGRMMEFGRPSGIQYAEGFTVNRLFAVNDLFALF